ncbi:MAG: Rieske (2Fe-2S) protein [Sphingobacteriales bacterium]|nr:MAG: Rieske (2Fe-2S) protein [Sphingobacteriales bacterium]TAF78866.1 MAG: Rieske (2Fe-2S) protein [Sphingobacteriales bacterium]
MERQEFLKSLGISFATVCASACLSSCGKDDTIKPDDSTPPPVNEPPLPAGTVSAKLSDLQSIGKSIIVEKVLFIRIADGNLASSFIAMFRLCPHNGGELFWNKTLIECGRHGARYETNGAVKNQPRVGGGSTSPLKLYPITLTSTMVNANTNSISS